jgi:ComF family protein
MWQLLFGATCVLCHQGLNASYRRLQLCRYCLADLPWLDSPDTLSPADDSPIRRVVTPLAYSGAARGWVLDAKRPRGLVAAQVLGSLLARAVATAYDTAEELPELVVPVPLALRRLLLRGHNQAILIATPVARILGRRLDRRALRRVRNTAIQPGLDPAARELNVAGAFRCRRRLHGARVAVVDDVVTTGATADAVAGALLDAGAAEVHLWAATRA